MTAFDQGFLLQAPFDALRDLAGGETVLPQDVGRLAGLAKLVLDADLVELAGHLAHEDVRHGVSQAADGAVLLHGDHLAALLRPLGDAGGVDGLDGVDVDDGGMDAVGLQQLRGLQGLADHQAAGEDGHVSALAEDVGLADLKGVVLLEDGRSQPGQAQVGGALVLRQGEDRLPGLLGVRRDDDGHARDGPHESQVLDTLVAAAVLAHADAGVGAAKLHVEVGIGHGVAYLVIGPARAKHGEGGAVGNEPHGGKAGRGGHHVGLRDAHVKEAVGMGGLEVLGHGGAGQVRVQDDHLVIPVAQVHQGLAVSFSRCDLVCHFLSPPVPSKPVRTARRWAPFHASPPDSP